MEYAALKKLNIPDDPGVYRFLGARRKLLYIGKATSLRDRLRSYFANDLLHTRGNHIVDMVASAQSVTWEKTDSALDALILEAALIKKFQPPANSREKDDKSFNYVVVSKEAFPAVFTIRERTMLSGTETGAKNYRYVFGPFTQGGSLQEALKIIRRILPFRDLKCVPDQGKPCFNRQIGLCPGVCTGEISQIEYLGRIKDIKLFFEGKKSAVLRHLQKMMHEHAKRQEFEQAGEYKHMIAALKHIKDATLIDADIRDVSQAQSRGRRRPYRIEAYDIAHISGTAIVGVMTVVEDGVKMKSDYRKFKIQAKGGANDTLHLEEILRRRLGHTEWQLPDLIVMDGGVAQKRVGGKVIQSLGLPIPVVSVVKDKHHKPLGIMGSKEIATTHKKSILLANAESHRFAVAYHRQLRGRMPMN